MSTQTSDERTKEEIIEKIAALAKAYTPEWKFDRERPDAAAALALIFADLFAGTAKRYKRIGEKQKEDFFAQLGLRAKPSVPAQGYVTFSMSSREFDGSRIPKGTTVTARTEDGKSVGYETTEPLYATPAELSALLYLDGRKDHMEQKDLGKPFTPFVQEGKNLQEHVLYLCQNEVLSVSGKARIRLLLQACRTDGEKAELSWLADQTQVSVSYGTGEGFIEFAKKRMEQGRLVLERAKGQPDAGETELFGKKGFWIRCSYLRAWNREPFAVQDIRLAAEQSGMEPDHIYNGEGEQQNARLFPFGECPAPFGECYIAAKEALGKPGAVVTLSFLLEYERIPLDNSVKVERQWKLLMKRSDFVPDPEYDITIEQIVWEYYNGNGWSRLSVSSGDGGAFDGKNGGKRLELEFICPGDAALLQWQSAPTRYLRVRVLRMNNLYRIKGAYITPVISDIRLQYSYEDMGERPKAAVACNGMETTDYPEGAWTGSAVRRELFYGMKEKEAGIYLGFDRPLQNGPIKLYLDIGERAGAGEAPARTGQPGLVYEYCGKKGFSPLEPFDGTKGLQRSGCVTFSGREDFAPRRICGVTAYWIRITQNGDGLRKEVQAQRFPKINGMYLNTVKALAAEQMPDEFFDVAAGEEHKVCRLRKGNVFDLSVRVNGERWEEVEDFADSGENDRHYVLDREQGIVRFSDGTNGAAPPAGEQQIAIRYRCGGGEEGNQPPGAVSGLNVSLGYVNRVCNHTPFCGGYDRESASGMLRRGADTLRHGGRAVTAGDYEALTCEASRFVRKVKCFPCYNLRGEYEPGCITLVVLQKDYKDGRRYFHRLREEIVEYLSGRAEGNLAAEGRLYVREPQFLELDCEVRAVAEAPEAVFEVQKNVEERLEAFLHPVTGNYHGGGWEIGTIPNETQIVNALKGVSGVRYIRSLRVDVYVKTAQGKRKIQPEGRDKADAAFCADIRFAMALGGKHTVVAEVDG